MVTTVVLQQKQRGAVLVVSLIILLVLIAISVSTANSTLMQEKMTSAVNDSHLALEGAELALRSAEAKIETLTSAGSFSSAGTNGLYTTGTTPADLFTSSFWNDTSKNAAATYAPVTGVTNARYFIEYLGKISEQDTTGDINMGSYPHKSAATVSAFRVVAHGVGRSADTERVLISMYAKSL